MNTTFKETLDGSAVLKTSVFVDEVLADGNAKRIHTIRTLLSLGETSHLDFTARPKNFTC